MYNKDINSFVLIIALIAVFIINCCAYENSILGYPGQPKETLAFTTVDTSLSNDPVKGKTEYKLIGHGDLNEELSKDKIFNETWEIAKKQSKNKSQVAIAKWAYSYQYMSRTIKSFYYTLNKSLREWYAQKKTEIFPYKNYMDILINDMKTFRKNLTLYRGEYHATTPIGKKGTVIFSDQLQSFTATKDMALLFMFDLNDPTKYEHYEGTMYKLSIDHAINITVDSERPFEDEYLIPPNHKFVIQDVRLPTKTRTYNEIDLVYQGNN